MKTTIGLAALAIAVFGCTTDAQYMQKLQPQAVQTAVNRGKVEMACQQVTGEVISEDMLQPAIQGFYARGGPERAEYTIGVSGCNQRQTYIVICPQDGSGGCFAAEGNN